MRPGRPAPHRRPAGQRRSSLRAHTQLPSLWTLLSNLARAAERPKHAIYKLAGAITAIALGQFHGLVDGGSGRCQIIYQELPYRNTKDVPVDGRKLLRRPHRCGRFDDRVELAETLDHAVEQRPREVGVLRVEAGIFDQALQ